LTLPWVVIAFLGALSATAGPATATPAGPESVSPDHVIQCFLYAYQPTPAPLGITAGGRVDCTDVLDYRYMKAILWRCILNTVTCYNQGEIYWTSPQPRIKELTAMFPCVPGTYRYHTQMYMEGFHGNWQYGQKDSPNRNITC
jgi:hypothetical protein